MMIPLNRIIMSMKPPPQQSRSVSASSTSDEHDHNDHQGLLADRGNSEHDFHNIQRVMECKDAVAVTETTTTLYYEDNENDEGDYSSSLHIPSVPAVPLQQALACHFETVDQSGAASRPACEYSNNGRPEYIYASTLLPNEQDLGITLESRQGQIVISQIAEKSPFQNTYIQPNDILVAINGRSCANATLKHMLELLQKPGQAKLSLCVHNPQGNPTAVASSICKPDTNSKVGITLSRHNDTIRISYMSKDSLLAESLVSPKQQCLAINGLPCECLSAHTGSAILAQSQRVSIVCKLHRSTAVALAVEEPTRHPWWRRRVMDWHNSSAVQGEPMLVPCAISE